MYFSDEWLREQDHFHIEVRLVHPIAYMKSFHSFKGICWDVSVDVLLLLLFQSMW